MTLRIFDAPPLYPLFAYPYHPFSTPLRNQPSTFCPVFHRESCLLIHCISVFPITFPYQRSSKTFEILIST